MAGNVLHKGISGKMEKMPVTDSASPFPAESPVNKEASSIYKSLIEELEVVFEHISEKEPVEPQIIDGIADTLIHGLNKHRDAFVNFVLLGEISEEGLAKSSVNCAILSALIAKELGIGEQKITEIVLGALLHDIGMLRLPSSILEKKGTLSNTELAVMKSHPDFGAKIAIKELSCPKKISFIIKEHHERWDGQGYPDNIAGAVIYPEARIISVADAFEAMLSRKPYRAPMASYEAIKNLLADNSRRFDPDILKVFTKVMGIYPVGSIVLLSNGAYGKIEKIRDISLRPKVKLLKNTSGKTKNSGEDEIVDLLFDKKLYIVKGVGPKEFAEKNT